MHAKKIPRLIQSVDLIISKEYSEIVFWNPSSKDCFLLKNIAHSILSSKHVMRQQDTFHA